MGTLVTRVVLKGGPKIIISVKFENQDRKNKAARCHIINICSPFIGLICLSLTDL